MLMIISVCAPFLFVSLSQGAAQSSSHIGVDVFKDICFAVLENFGRERLGFPLVDSSTANPMKPKIYFYIAAHTLLPIVLSVLLITIPLALVYCFVPPRPPLEFAIFIVVFGLLGAIVGILTGSSRQAAVGSILPAVLTFITAILMFFFTTEGLKPVRQVIPYCLLSLLLLSIYWVYIGSKIRVDADTSDYYLQRWQNALRFERIELELEKARKFKAEGLPIPTASPNSAVTVPGLPPEFATPASPTKPQ
jgi:hypothetical protein